MDLPRKLAVELRAGTIAVTRDNKILDRFWRMHLL